MTVEIVALSIAFVAGSIAFIVKVVGGPHEEHLAGKRRKAK